MLVWGTVLAGSVLIALGAVAILYEGKHFTRKIRQCCRCLHTWAGQAKYCNRCQAASHTGEVDSRKAPEYDWQGHMDTQPIRMVR